MLACAARTVGCVARGLTNDAMPCIGTRADPATTTTMTEEVLRLHNEYRKEHGAAPLTYDMQLQASAWRVASQVRAQTAQNHSRFCSLAVIIGKPPSIDQHKSQQMQKNHYTTSSCRSAFGLTPLPSSETVRAKTCTGARGTLSRVQGSEPATPGTARSRIMTTVTLADPDEDRNRPSSGTSHKAS